MSKDKKAIRTRKKLWRKDKKCFYCGVITMEPPKNFDFKSDPPDNMATVDHVYSKKDIRRLLKNGKKELVLCCYKCNNDRMKRENCAMSDKTHILLYGEPIDIREFLNY
jgi:5-methylcytosine-specific restriction endonuclease McrA